MSVFLINPFVLQPITNITRTFFDAGYTVTRATTTSATMTSRMSLTTTEIASTNYAAFWMATHDNTGTTSDSRVQLFETSVRQLQNLEPQDATDRFSSGGMYAYAGGTNKTFQIQTSTESGTHGYAGYGLNILQLTSADAFVTNLTLTTTSSTTFTNFISTTFPQSGNYIVVGSAEVNPLSSNADARLFYNNTTGYGSLGEAYKQDTTNYSPHFHVQRITGVTAGQTIALQIKADAALGGAMGIRGASLLALNTDGFENFYYAEQPTTQTTTSTTYTSGLSQTFSILNPSNKHLILASAMMRVDATNSSGFCKLINTTSSTDYNVEHLREANAVSEWYPTVVTRIVTFTESSNTIQWQSRAENAGTAIDLKNMSIAIFDLGTT